MSKFPYKALEKFVLRTPSKSLSFFRELIDRENIPEQDLKEICSDLYFQEALFLASPTLHNTLIEWLAGKTLNKEKTEKLKNSLLKYLSRMSTRCTPFGLFAGYSLGQFADFSNISLNHLSLYKKYTRLDTQYLVMLSQNFVKNKTIRNTLKYTPNTSLYKIGNQYRYIEYKYSADLKRSHHIEGVENDLYFEYLINAARKGNTIYNLANELIDFDSEISIKEARKYINSLLDNQILVSEIDPVIIGANYFQIIKQTINSKKISNTLIQIDNNLRSIDAQIPNSIDRYYEVKSIAENLSTDIDLKYFFQTDLKISTKENFLEKKILKEIKEGIIFLNKLSIISKNSSASYLENFIKKFKTRYEDQHISLAKALDPESGIGYKNNDMDDIIPDNNFIDNLIIPSSNSIKNEISWTNVNSIFNYKITQAYKDGNYTIKLTQEDLPAWIDETYDDLPDTLSFLTEIVKNNGQQKIKFEGAGGASGSNLFGRFCSSDSDLFNYTKEIIEIERKINSNLILADLSHLPESRIGNVISRPSFNDYEIPYLSKSIKPIDQQIRIDDLMLFVKGKKIILYSKKLNKEILPRLVNAHNYSMNALPIYHFLSDLQNQGKRSGLGLDLGAMVRNYKFIPRIELNNLILKPATWNLRKKDMELFTENPKSDKDFLEAANKTQTKWKMPQYILLAENDNELLINLKNTNSIKMMIDAIGQKANFTFKEFLFTDKEQIVKRDDESFTNQVIITFYNNQKLQNANNI